MKTKRITCDNAAIGTRVVVGGGCYGNEATVKMIITYKGGYDYDALDLCEACAALVKRDAERYGYTVKVVKTNGRKFVPFTRRGK